MPNTVPKRKRLGELLIDGGLITPGQLQNALQEQKRTGEKLGQILVNLGYITEETLGEFLGNLLGVPYVNLENYVLDPRVVNLIPENIARTYQLVAIAGTNTTLTAAMADPLNVFATDEVRRRTGLKVDTVVSIPSVIKKVIDQYYGASVSAEEVIKGIDLESVAVGEEIKPEQLQRIAEETPVIKLVNLIIMQAIRDRASDIHIEPAGDTLRIRFRIDGVLHEVMNLPPRLHPAVVSRLKIMANLDIAEKRIPQDGRMEMKVTSREVDLRVAILPTIFGEKVALRVLDKSSALLSLEELGMSSATLNQFVSLIANPYGIILVTGPTGSGKTTTLYAAINKINTVEKNIITIEDPVEYKLKNINQIQVNPRAGITYANALRSVLRQDPDIIMVGEIRDRDTADIAIHAALTGHLVFSTLHTNDSSGALARLLDMGVEPFLIASPLIGVLAQRLVRFNCSRCKESYEPAAEILQSVGMASFPGKITFSRGKGCGECKGTGYRGRTGIFELLSMNNQLREQVVNRVPQDTIRRAAISAGMMVLRENGLLKVQQGVTTVEEVLRVTQAID